MVNTSDEKRVLSAVRTDLLHTSAFLITALSPCDYQELSFVIRNGRQWS